MVTWYCVRKYSNAITDVPDVVRETEQSLVLAPDRAGRKERTFRKVTEHERYFATRAEAVAYLTDRITSRIALLERELINLKATLAKGF